MSPQPHRPPPQQKRPRRDDTPTSKRILMAVTGIGILLILYYFFGASVFPTDITYRNLASPTGSSYVIQREAPSPY